MADILYECEVCKTKFPLTKRFQVYRDGDKTRFFCSETCRTSAVKQAKILECEICGKRFAQEYAYQSLPFEGVEHNVCSIPCRTALTERLAPPVYQAARVCIANQKGGTGKTTTAFHLAAGFAAKGIPVLLVDADPQGSLTELFKVNSELGLAEVLRGQATLLTSVQLLRENLFLLPVGKNLNELTYNKSLSGPLVRKQFGSIADYRLVIIDVSPAQSPLTEAMLAFAGAVLVPVSCDYLAIHGVSQLSDTLRSLRDNSGRLVELLGLIPTFFDGRTRASRNVINILNRQYPNLVLSPIRASADIRETGQSTRTVFEANPSGRGAHDYRTLLNEVGKRLKLD